MASSWEDEGPGAALRACVGGRDTRTCVPSLNPARPHNGGALALELRRLRRCCMAVFLNQPIAHRFGKYLLDELSAGRWSRFQAAVAWVRRSGTRHLMPTLRAFLQGGGEIRLIVGVDIAHTSFEGLEDLLSLATFGSAITHVFHNEDSAVFHPKLYLLSNTTDARLVVGSNNITESGLYTNTEVALTIDDTPLSKVVVDAETSFDSWRDPLHGMAKQLDAALLADLLSMGYVKRERDLLALLRSQQGTSKGGTKSSRPPLFGRLRVVAPPVPAVGAAAPAAPGVGAPRRAGAARVAPRPADQTSNVLLMRPRLARGNTQLQVPIGLYHSNFFNQATHVVSGHDGHRRPISATRPERGKGKTNTLKLEIPEAKSMQAPVIRFDRAEGQITYRAYEDRSSSGRLIAQALEDGRKSSPVATVLTKPSTPDSATWYRFI